MSIERNPVIWDLDLTPILDTPVTIVTEEGGRRHTTITDVVFKDIQLGDLICPVPKRFILEGDANDFIEVAVIESVSATVKE
jgi:hypothetical protein